MNQEIMIQVGRAVLVTNGKYENKLAVIIDILNQNNVIVSGPTTNVPRQVMNTSKLRLTKFRVANVLRNQREKKLIEKVNAFKLVEKFNETNLGLKIRQSDIRSNLTDYERFQVFLLKRKLNNKKRTLANKLKKK